MLFGLGLLPLQDNGIPVHPLLVKPHDTFSQSLVASIMSQLSLLQLSFINSLAPEKSLFIKFFD